MKRRLLPLLVCALLAGCSTASNQTAPTSEWFSGTALDHASSGSWIERLNHYRAMAGVPPVVEERRLSAADRAHARYLVRNFDSDTDGASAHFETPGNPGYTPEGDRAGRRSDVALRKVIVQSPMDTASEEIGDAAIDEWIAAPFHRLDLLDPSVTSVGWGSAHEDDASASVLEVKRAPRWSMRRHGRPRPVMFPSNGSAVPFGAYPGGEWPSPLAACGYDAPSGLPITIQFGPASSLALGSHSITEDGAAIEHCVYDADDDPGAGASDEAAAAVSAMRKAGAIILVPRAPMVPGPLYAVSIEVNGRRYAWSFRIAPASRPPTMRAEASASSH